MIPFAALLLLAVAADEDPAAWGRFSRSPSLSGEAVLVEIGSLPGGSGYWMRRTTQPIHGSTAARIDWADSRHCPAIRERLMAMRRLDAPRFHPPFLDNDDMVVTADGVDYQLTAPADYGGSDYAMTIETNVGTPLASWVDDTLTALAPCWRAAKPADI